MNQVVPGLVVVRLRVARGYHVLGSIRPGGEGTSPRNFLFWHLDFGLWLVMLYLGHRAGFGNWYDVFLLLVFIPGLPWVFVLLTAVFF